MTSSDLPVIHIDRPILDADLAYVSGRATLTGPGDDLLADAMYAVIGIGHHWDAARFSAFPTLRVLSRMGIGYDNVEVAAAEAADVIVCNAPDSPTVSTAEHTMALLLAVSKDLPAKQKRSRQGETGPGGPVTSLELDGATIGLVGLGRIACRVARAAQGLGMDVLAHDPFLAESPVAGVQMVDLPTLFARSKVLSLHAPSTPETRHMVNAESLAQLPAGAYIINCARGPLIDHDALHAALESGHLAGAGLDVTDPEPLPADHPLLSRDDVLVTPHIASSTAIGRRRLFEHAIENVLNVIADQPASIVTAQ